MELNYLILFNLIKNNVVKSYQVSKMNPQEGKTKSLKDGNFKYFTNKVLIQIEEAWVP